VTLSVPLIDDDSHLFEFRMLVTHRGSNVAVPHRIHDDFQILGSLVDEGAVGIVPAENLISVKKGEVR